MLVKIVTEILFWQCALGEPMIQPSWQQIKDQHTKKKRDLDRTGTAETKNSPQASNNIAVGPGA